MKDTLKKLLEKTIKYLAGRMIKKYQPGIIAVTGSVGKTSTKEAIYAALIKSRTVRASGGNFNNELGMPLTILGDWKKIEGKFFWIKVIFSSLIKLIFKVKYPEALILEYAAAKPGDMKYLLDIARPTVSVVTAIGDIPVHVEFFSGPEAIAREKAKIVEVLPTTSFAILNFDDQAVLDMKQRTRAHVITYGFGDGAEIQITNFENRMDGNKPAGISFKLNYGGSFVPIRLDNCFGKAQAYAAAAATAVGIIYGVNIVKIAEALLEYESPERRGKLIEGIKYTYILDDSYNASPLSMHAAIETVKSLKAARKIAVLGDMLEIGKYTVEAHETIGELAGKVFDILITVGGRAKFIAETAGKSGIAKKNIYSFDTADDAKLKVQELIKKGDLILIKASHAMELDKVVEEIKA
ncbi:MAG: Mur ligase family protein [Candidatus Pacebacteria bacterium]|nr:Mur ligase family protein [Candidatus Paceibacterota bacterium]